MDTLWRTTFAFRYRSEYGGIGVPYPLDVLPNVGVFALPRISYFGGRIWGLSLPLLSLSGLLAYPSFQAQFSTITMHCSRSGDQFYVCSGKWADSSGNARTYLCSPNTAYL